MVPKQKNTELFLDALKNVDLRDYSVVFIGPIEKEECDFQSYIDTYFVENSKLKEKVHFIELFMIKKNCTLGLIDLKFLFIQLFMNRMV